MTREEMTAMFSEYSAEGTTPDRQGEILASVLDENDRVLQSVETAQNEAQAARDAYNKLRAQYVNRFLSGGPANPGDSKADPMDVADGGDDSKKRRAFSDLFKEV